MGFLEHLQSSIILGTRLDYPRSKHLESKKLSDFFHAIDHKDYETLEQMLDEGFDLETKHPVTSHTPLMHALIQGHDDMLFFFVNLGANIYTTDKEQNSLFFHALRYGSELFINYLIRYHAFNMQSHAMRKKSFQRYNQDRKLPTLSAYSMLQSDFEFDEDIFRTVRRGDIAQLVYYLNNQGDPQRTNSKKQTLLHLAIIAGSKPMILLLLNQSISIDCKDKFGNTPLIYSALYPNRLGFLKLLIKRQATLNQSNHSEHTALTMAIRKHNFDAIWELLKNGANINLRDGINTPLSLAHDHLSQAKNDQERSEFRKLLRFLTIHGAHVDAVGDIIEWTPLQLTINYFDSDFYLSHMEKLVNLGADIEKIDKVGRTPLMLAAGLGREKSVEFLVAKKAHMDRLDNYGWSALMLATYNNNFPIVKYLINHGADVNLKSKGELSALKIAQDQNNELIAIYLKEHGATPIE